MISKILEEINWFLYFIKRPEWWMRSFMYSPEFDVWLNEALDNPRFQDAFDRDAVILNGRKVYLKNYPCEYCCLHVNEFQILSKRRTAIRFEEIYNAYSSNFI